MPLQRFQRGTDVAVHVQVPAVLEPVVVLPQSRQQVALYARGVQNPGVEIQKVLPRLVRCTHASFAKPEPGFLHGLRQRRFCLVQRDRGSEFPGRNDEELLEEIGGFPADERTRRVEDHGIVEHGGSVPPFGQSAGMPHFSAASFFTAGFTRPSSGQRPLRMVTSCRPAFLKRSTPPLSDAEA